MSPRNRIGSSLLLLVSPLAQAWNYPPPPAVHGWRPPVQAPAHWSAYRQPPSAYYRPGGYSQPPMRWLPRYPRVAEPAASSPTAAFPPSETAATPNRPPTQRPAPSETGVTAAPTEPKFAEPTGASHTRQPDIADHKAAFLDRLAPLVRQANREIQAARHRLLRLQQRLQAGTDLSAADAEWLASLARDYRVGGDPVTQETARDELVVKVDRIPLELALAQAANESAWGRSRFAREAFNLFGVWTYDESQGLVPKRRETGKKHLVRKYEDFAESVSHYLLLLNSHPAYAELRRLRSELRAAGKEPDGLSLAAGLEKYSAKGREYVALIQGIIRHNELARYRLAGNLPTPSA